METKDNTIGTQTAAKGAGRKPAPPAAKKGAPVPAKGKGAAAKPAKANGTKVPAKAPPKRGGARGGQKQDAGPAMSQGVGSGTPTVVTTASGRQVEIEVVAMANRGGRRPGAEAYPFGELGLSRKVDGVLTGPSFFIPKSENPKAMIAAARKRHKATSAFDTRQENKDGQPGIRVWRSPAKA